MTSLAAAFGVVLDNDSGRFYAWGPFPQEATAARFAEFATRAIDPARVAPWTDVLELSGVRLLDPVTELLNWRDHIAELSVTIALDTDTPKET